MIKLEEVIDSRGCAKILNESLIRIRYNNQIYISKCESLREITTVVNVP